MNDKEVYCLVYGDVQGVSYRQYAREKARALGVTGYAKNMEDGTVEVVAQGPEETLRNYLGFISAGPETAQVESINVSWGPIDEEKFSSFDVL